MISHSLFFLPRENRYREIFYQKKNNKKRFSMALSDWSRQLGHDLICILSPAPFYANEVT